jgi:NitT/TauT family transport system ATP-binding protein/nitrate/nitrite transport system substrate-binding protein
MTRSATPVRFGLLRLADSAPAIIALHERIFRELDLDVVLSVEPSWANIADKLTYGLLDAASLLPPLVLAARIGLRGPPARILVPMGLTSGGNTVTLGQEAASAIGDSSHMMDAPTAGRLFRGWLQARAAPPRVAVVHAFSTHNLLLRHWLAASDVDPDRDVETVVIPPEDVETALARGQVAAFCAGAPWGQLAADRGTGRTLLGTSAIWAAHAEKCLALSESWVLAQPDAAVRLMRGLLRAQRICDRPEAAPVVSAALAAPPLHLDRAASLACLPGGSGAEQVRFHGDGIWFPWRSHAVWYLEQMRRWGWIAPGVNVAAVASGTYRPDLLARAAAEEGEAWPAGDAMIQGTPI